MRIGLAYAMEEEIASLLADTGAKHLETARGVSVYEIEPGILAYAGGIGKVNAAMSAQYFIDRYQPDWIVNAGVGRKLPTICPSARWCWRRILSNTISTPPP